MAKHGKSYNAAAEKIDRATLYTPLQAAKLIKELDTAKFDETVEAHFRLGIEPQARHRDYGRRQDGLRAQGWPC